MVKKVRCSECSEFFEVAGEDSKAIEVPTPFNCFECGAPNQVSWPDGQVGLVRAYQEG